MEMLSAQLAQLIFVYKVCGKQCAVCIHIHMSWPQILSKAVLSPVFHKIIDRFACSNGQNTNTDCFFFNILNIYRYALIN